MRKLLIIPISLILACGTPQKVTTETLLNEMVDKTMLARFPNIDYKLLQCSSYDRSSVNADSTDSWFANWDSSNFLRTDTIDGRVEYVMFDQSGAGAVVRLWATVAGYQDNGTIRFYFDGSDKPEIEGELLNVISGGALVGEPLSTSVAKKTDLKQRGHNLYLPIAYAKGLKITYQSETVRNKNSKHEGGEWFYYSINYRQYKDNVVVESFKKDDVTKLDQLIKKVSSTLINGDDVNENWTQKSASINDSDKSSIKFGADSCIRKISVKIDAQDIAQALRSTILKIKFDGVERVWAPIGDFFGSGNRLSPYKGFYSNVEKDGTMSCYWVMPYKESCEIELENLAQEDVKAQLVAFAETWTWDDRSMYFNASWKQYSNVYTGLKRSMDGTSHQKDLNYATLTGKGVYVGDVLTLFNTIADWWGEGDEKIYIDGEKFPSHFGTGTEDYYGYAWCLPEFFEHPFIAQPDGSGDLQVGHTVNLRHRALDKIVFNESLVFDMELWHWGSTYLNYAPTVFWYQMDGDAVKPQPETAKMKVAKYKNDIVSNVIDENGNVEGEYLKTELSGGLEKSQMIMDMPWSNHAQLLWRDSKVGDKAILSFVAKQKGVYDLKMNITFAKDFGKFNVNINGVSKNIDCFSNDLTAKVVELGKVELNEGENRITVTNVGKNNNSTNFLFGLDKVCATKK